MNPDFRSVLVIIGCFFAAAFFLWLSTEFKLRQRRRQQEPEQPPYHRLMWVDERRGISAQRDADQIVIAARRSQPIQRVNRMQCPRCSQWKALLEMHMADSGPFDGSFVCDTCESARPAA